MMKCLYLLYVVFHVTAGCDLSGDETVEIIQHQGGSVLLPCSCSDLHIKPHTFTWMSYRTGHVNDMLNDEHYRGRHQLFNNSSPGNLSLLISDLREEDQGDYRCSTEKGHRDIRIYVKGCDLSAQTKYEYNGHPGGSVLLLCSCSDLHTKPHTFTWMAYRTGRLTDMLNDEHYRGRLQLFNHISPGNLSLLISDLREEDAVDYRCRTEKEHRDMSINVKGGRRESSTRSETTDRRPPTEQPQITTISAPTSSSTTLEQAQKQPHSGVPLVLSIVAAFLLVIVGVMAFICWRRKGRRKNVITEGCPKQTDQTVPDVTYSTVSHIHTAGAARVLINVGEKTEYACIVTN
ncbi:uncharacterized protein LOC113662366 isoform X12 [Tachysurus fulvidraco]|uniref:uncharacterized protein LOC113662366 isoform X12 n=1 Tax=Tachysurus fulvidraco TaxID=1234273 RepID=UPI001FEF9193|nr:uncharacterized protein LOC113662366 isoform X12 [Tachysurus fulvidraco]